MSEPRYDVLLDRRPGKGPLPPPPLAAPETYTEQPVLLDRLACRMQLDLRGANRDQVDRIVGLTRAKRDRGELTCPRALDVNVVQNLIVRLGLEQLEREEADPDLRRARLERDHLEVLRLYDEERDRRQAAEQAAAAEAEAQRKADAAEAKREAAEQAKRDKQAEQERQAAEQAKRDKQAADAEAYAAYRKQREARLAELAGKGV